MKDLTIIVPCYNNAKFLHNCLDSIVDNDYQNYNVIIVDDCSTDNSLEIIKEYASKYKNITYFVNEKNMGAGFSRNKALAKCTTKYVTFLDSDDYINKDYYQVLIKNIKEFDVIVADIMLEYPDKKTLAPCCEGKKTRENLINNGFAASPCNKIFKTSFLKKYPFAEGIMNEDICAVISCLINGKVTYCNSVYYNYVQHKSSIQNTRLSSKRLDIFKSLEILKEYNPNLNKDIYDIIFFNQIILFLFYVVSKENNLFVQVKFLRKFSKYFSAYYKDNNKALAKFLANQSKLHKMYYKLQIKLANLHLNILLSLLFTSYKFYKKFFTKNVLKKQYELNDLVRMAKKNQSYPEKKSLTVVIPNYNYEKFIYQRLYSILYQKYKINKIIILDDASTDNSVKVIKEVIASLNSFIPIELIVNKTNSGSAFKQWQKGINLVDTEYLWIAEADDYCDSSFLKSIFDKVENQEDIALAYTNTAFIDEHGLMIRRSVVPDIDIQNSHHWQEDFISEGLEELKNYAFLNCTIANVSSVILKTEFAKKSTPVLDGYKQAGDWAFYNEMMRHGKVLYINKNINYYRFHGNNATTLNKKQLHFNEIKKVHKSVENIFKLNKKQKDLIEERYEFLEEVWGVER